VATETHGHVGADLASLCSEAALQQVVTCVLIVAYGRSIVYSNDRSVMLHTDT